MFPHLSRYAEKTHQELFEEARRPVDSITPEHIEKLLAAVAQQRRFKDDPKTRWECEYDGE